jgi:CRP-like cAMP-binding protein
MIVIIFKLIYVSKVTSAPLPTPVSSIQLRTLAKGETLFLQGDQTFAIFAVRRGRVRLMRHLADGSTLPLHVAHDGETFSEAAIYSKNYHCDAIADVESEVEIHPIPALSRVLDKNPEAARIFMAHLARQVIDLRSRLEIRNIRSAEERVVQFLQLQVGESDLSITFTRPLKDISGDIGLTHEAFYRALAKLEESGVITRSRRTITLLS